MTGDYSIRAVYRVNGMQVKFPPVAQVVRFGRRAVTLDRWKELTHDRD